MLKHKQHHWYVIHTYTSYEERVAQEIKQRIGSLGMEDRISEVLVPKENQIELKNGKRKIVAKKFFKAMYLLKCI